MGCDYDLATGGAECRPTWPIVGDTMFELALFLTDCLFWLCFGAVKTADAVSDYKQEKQRANKSENCLECDYCLTGTLGAGRKQCPECGKKVERWQTHSWKKRHTNLQVHTRSVWKSDMLTDDR